MVLRKKDIWEFGDGYLKVHLTNLNAYRKIKDTLEIKDSTYYSKDGNVFAWDLVIESNKLTKVKKILKEFN